MASKGMSRLGFISPAIGRLAAELGVDLAQVVGTGANGRITRKDVLAWLAAPVPRGDAASAAAGREFAELSRWEDSIEIGAPALRHQTSPYAITVMEADLGRVIEARGRLRTEFEQQGVELSLTPFFLQAIVAGLKAVPEANRFAADGQLVQERINIGLAAAISDGPIQVIRDADEKSLLGLARAANDLAERVRANKLTSDEVQGATFTLIDHGASGSLFATPIIKDPQTGILSVGATQKRAVILSKGNTLLPDADDTIAIRPMAYLGFTFDHCILDGRAADRFLMAVKRFLEGYAVTLEG